MRRYYILTVAFLFVFCGFILEGQKNQQNWKRFVASAQKRMFPKVASKDLFVSACSIDRTAWIKNAYLFHFQAEGNNYGLLGQVKKYDSTCTKKEPVLQGYTDIAIGRFIPNYSMRTQKVRSLRPNDGYFQGVFMVKKSELLKWSYDKLFQYRENPWGKKNCHFSILRLSRKWDAKKISYVYFRGNMRINTREYRYGAEDVVKDLVDFYGRRYCIVPISPDESSMWAVCVSKK